MELDISNYVNDNDYISTNIPSNQNILPVAVHEKPINSPPTGTVVSQFAYTDSLSLDNHSIAPEPSTTKSEFNTYDCSWLKPAPRDPNKDISENLYCKKVKSIKEVKDYGLKNPCYKIYDAQQKVNSWVCLNQGGTNNANFARGNTFGNSYSIYSPKDLKQYSAEYPMIMETGTPGVVNKNQILFTNPDVYPYPNFNLRNDPQYRTYPYFNNYTPNGLPFYQFPERVVNLEGFSNNVESDYDKEIRKNELTISVVIYILLFIFIIFLIYQIYTKKNN